jgi:hypothetical protein
VTAARDTEIAMPLIAAVERLAGGADTLVTVGAAGVGDGD